MPARRPPSKASPDQTVMETITPPTATTTKEFGDIKVTGNRADPALWVERLEVYAAWPPNDETNMRRIHLRRGLNILWATALHPENNKKARFSGHGAGKTTFCRLLRYILAENSYGPADFREALHLKEPQAWVLGEVWVENRLWLVGRPLRWSGGGAASFAVPDATIASLSTSPQPPRDDFSAYEAAIDHAVFQNMEERRLPSSKESLDWLRLVQWLSRDQEFHYSGLSKWRHPDSDHKAPHLSDDERSNLMRMVMGVLNPKEQSLIVRHTELADKHTKAVESRGNHAFAIKQRRADLQKELREALALTELPGDLQDMGLAKQITELKAQWLQPLDLTSLHATHAAEQKALAEKIQSMPEQKLPIEVDIEGIRLELEPLQEELPMLTGEPIKPHASFKRPRLKLSAYLLERVRSGPWAGYCSRTRPEAEALECPHFVTRQVDGDTKKALAPDTTRIKTMKAQIAELEKALTPLEKKLSEMEEAENQMVEDLQTLQNEHAQIIADRQNEGRLKAQKLDLLFELLHSAANAETQNESTIEILHKAKRDIDEDLAKAKTSHQNLLGSLSDHFALLARHLLGNNVTAWVDIKGKAIEPELKAAGRLDSSALKVVKYLCFDLAALMLGLTNSKCHHPRFLLHDSPREADLDAGIYHELFTAARELEKTSDSLPAFQYIVTTTEPPPKDFQQPPWRLEPVLDATQAELRFLGVNLG